MKIVIITIVITFIITVCLLIKKLMAQIESPEIDWKTDEELPEDIFDERSISKDVLIYDLDTKELYLGYYSYSNDLWVVCSEKTAIKITNFVWAYINH